MLFAVSLRTWLIGGVAAFLATILLAFVSHRTLRAIVWVVTKLLYRIDVHGIENLPKKGGALLVSNHVSWLDGILLMLITLRPVRMIVYAGNFRNRYLLSLARSWRAILIDPGPKSIVAALKTARESVKAGELVGIFPEGGISRSGNLQSFRAGLMKILKGTDAPVIPIYLDGVWGSIFSFERRRFFWKIPRRWRYPIQIHIGRPLANASDVHEVRRVVQELGARAVVQRVKSGPSLQAQMIKSCKRRMFRSKLADSTGMDVSGAMLLMRTLILRKLLRRYVLRDEDRCVAVLIPPSVPAAIVNLALSFDRRTVVNLNYTVSSEVLNECLRTAKIRKVLTSAKVLEKLDLKLDAELVLLDELREKVTRWDKVSAFASAYLCPSRLLSAKLGFHSIPADEVVTVIFTSGSTGNPKGVMLTQANIIHNADAMNTVIHLTPDDVIVGILPFFHSFGYTITLWTVVALDIKGIYHFSPLDARPVAKMCAKHRATILLSTPTFLRNFVRRCEKEDLITLDTVVTGAERLPKELADAFEQKFGVRPVEGYGTTELSPLVSVNIPSSRSEKTHQIDAKEGTVGRPIPGVSAKIVDLDSGQELGTNTSGMLLIKGANVMKGYLNMPEKTAEVIRDGWYVTGDVAQIDDDGFIRITGRESRFSKIGGEMVPHIKIEETLIEIVGVNDDSDPQIAVTAVPDEKKGERLVVLHETLSKGVNELRKGLQERGLPNIYIPSADSFFLVDQVPVLGTGKLDLRRIKELALELCGSCDEHDSKLGSKVARSEQKREPEAE